jgi:DcmR-like sensory protein/histidine kinase-like protein
MAELAGAQLEHDAFLYGSDEQLVTAMVPFLREGLTRGDAAAAVTTPGNLALLRDRLGADAHVSYVEAADWYVRPSAAIAQFDAAIRELIDGGAPHLRVVGELPFGSTAGEHASWNRYEAIVNEAFKRAPLWVVCLYDTRALPEQLIEAARRTHPTLFEARRRRQSARLRRAGGPARPDPGARRAGGRSAEAAAADRRRPARLAPFPGWGGRGRSPAPRARRGVPDRRRRAGRQRPGARSRPGRAHLWSTNDGVVCAVHDDGPGVDDPFAGYLPPGNDDAAQGMGLWVARQLSDSLAIQSGADGTTVRLGIGR